MFSRLTGSAGLNGRGNGIKNGVLILAHDHEHRAVLQRLQLCAAGDLVLIGQVILKAGLLIVDIALKGALYRIGLPLGGHDRRNSVGPARS